MVSFVCIYVGWDSFLEGYFSFPSETYLSEGIHIVVSGQIDRKEQASDYQILYLKNNSIIYQEQYVQEPYMIIYDKSKKKVRLGNTIRVSGKLSFYEKERNPGNFSQKDYYRSQKIVAYMWTDEVRCIDDKSDPVRDFLSEIRNRWKQNLQDYAGERYGGILSAILLGDKKEMDTEIRELYQVNGIAHILAISGLHLSFIGLGFYRMLRRLTGSYAVGGAAGIAFLLLYIVMIGSSVSAIRALIMFCIRVGADMSGRVYDAPTSVAAAAALIILWRPLAFFDAGFQLSFGAVGGIIFLYPLIAEGGFGNSGRKKEGKNGREGSRRELREKNGIEERRRERRTESRRERRAESSLILRIKDSFMASLCIQTATLPAILFHYYEIPVYSVFLNLIVIPLMSVLLVFGFVGSLLCLFWQGGGGFFLGICRGILRLYEMLCQITGFLPGDRVTAGQPEIAGIIVYMACILLLMVLIYRRKADRRILAAIAVSGISALILACPAVNHRGLEVTFLDVGQGDGIFIRERGGITCLIDGGSSDVSKVGKYRIEPFLKARGVSEIDYAFVTHGDSDHISGLEELLERQSLGVRINCVVFPEEGLWDEKMEDLYLLARKWGTRAAVIHPGQQIKGRELVIGCLYPDEKKLAETGNAASLVLEASYGEIDVLLTGDVEGEGEELLTAALEKEYEVLKVAHHGSKNSTSEEFLGIVHPKLAVISSGRDNRYGHPHEETLERLEDAKAVVFTTAESGAIILRADGKEVEDLKIIRYRPGS